LELDGRIFVCGHNGLVGSALVRLLRREGFTDIVTRSRAELDLRDQGAVSRFFDESRPGYLFLAAAKVGGILANNTYRAEFIRDNLAIQTNIIHEAWRTGVRRLVFLGSSCIYPRMCPQPMKEEHLLTGPLEKTNEPYAVAKIAGLKMVEAYNAQYGLRWVSAMPTNLYGPNDNYDLNNSHVLPALIRKAHEAKVGKAESMVVWGTGAPKREFLHVDDLAEALLFMMNHDEIDYLVNVGSGQERSIRELVEVVTEVVGFEGKIIFDSSKPDGTPRKLLDTSILDRLGWKARIGLKEGVKSAYVDYLKRFGDSK